MSRYAHLLALVFAVAFVDAATPPSGGSEEKVASSEPSGVVASSNVVQLTTDNFLEWTRSRNRSIVLFYANGLGNQLKAKNNFRRAAAIATMRKVDMEWAMVDCLQVASWICTRLGFTGFPPARLVTANETSWNKTEWTQDKNAVPTLVAVAHYLSGDDFYQAHEEVVWGGGPNNIIHAVGDRLVETHAQATVGTLVSMMSQRCPNSITFFGSQLIPLSNSEEFDGVNIVVNTCDMGIGAKFCSMHGTVNYPNLKFFRPDEDVTNKMHGTMATPDDLLDLPGFLRKCLTKGIREL